MRLRDGGLPRRKDYNPAIGERYGLGGCPIALSQTSEHRHYRHKVICETLAIFEREPELAKINAQVPHRNMYDVDQRFSKGSAK